MKTRNLQHRIVLHAAPKTVYEALMDQKKHSQFTSAPAKVSRKIGGAFSAYGKYVTGINLELKAGKRVVQAWRSEGWPDGYYSIVTFALLKKAGGGTELRFTQIGIPAADYSKKNRGWREHYWEPLKRYLEK